MASERIAAGDRACLRAQQEQPAPHGCRDDRAHTGCPRRSPAWFLRCRQERPSAAAPRMRLRSGLRQKRFSAGPHLGLAAARDDGAEAIKDNKLCARATTAGGISSKRSPCAKVPHCVSHVGDCASHELGGGLNAGCDDRHVTLSQIGFHEPRIMLQVGGRAGIARRCRFRAHRPAAPDRATAPHSARPASPRGRRARCGRSVSNISSTSKRRQSERGLIENEQARLCHQAAADGEHLLFAARERASQLPRPFAQPRKRYENAFEIFGCGSTLPAPVGAKLQVFADAHVGKNLAAFGHVDQARQRRWPQAPVRRCCGRRKQMLPEPVRDQPGNGAV